MNDVSFAFGYLYSVYRFLFSFHSKKPPYDNLFYHRSPFKTLFIQKVGPVDKLKKNDLLYSIIIISIAGSYLYDGKTEWANSDGDSGYRFYDSTEPSPETD